MMKPQFDLCTLRTRSRISLWGLSPNASSIPVASALLRFPGRRTALTTLAFLGITLAGLPVLAQQPSPIPNWSAGDPGTAAGQYAPSPQDGQYPQQDGQYPQQPQYAQPQYQPPPQYQQQYGQQEYAQP